MENIPVLEVQTSEIVIPLGQTAVVEGNLLLPSVVLLLIAIFSIVRLRNIKMGGLGKGLWVIIILFLPLLGPIISLIVLRKEKI
ncbi:MAG: PLDc N-terminal domain-containing protein [Spirochaetales bacterium]|jgi:hypothetical protein|nr:PLDc N-terminal domain-containing protein [Spirochaetales bacterium]